MNRNVFMLIFQCIRTYTYIYICVCVCTYMYMYIHLYVYILSYIHGGVYVSMYASFNDKAQCS